jgi:hypothetical protein
MYPFSDRTLPESAAVTLTIILLAVFCLAYANGANDHFKGVGHAVRERHDQLPKGLALGHGHHVSRLTDGGLVGRTAPPQF